MKLIDYHTGAILATFDGPNIRNLQVMAWIREHGFLVHHQRGNRVYLIK